jgi:uncharacterized transporter YbjL
LVTRSAFTPVDDKHGHAQAALDVMKNKDPSIGYSIAYPFGVIGPILCIYFMTQMVKPKFPAKAQRFHMGEISIGEKCPARLSMNRKEACRAGSGDDGSQRRANVVPAG